MRVQPNTRSAVNVGVVISVMFIFFSCSGGGDGGSQADSGSSYTGTYSLKDYSVHSVGNTMWASQAFENFEVDCVIHEDGFMEFSGCFKYPGEPEQCGADSGIIEDDTLTIAEAACTYSANVKLGDGKLYWEFPPSCGNHGDGPSVWHWTKVSDTTPKSLMSVAGETINMITESLGMMP